MSKNSFLIVLSQKKVLIIFLIAKLLRFIMFFLFLTYLLKAINDFSGYSSDEVIFFFLTFNLIDIITQFLFREVYRFRGLVVSGDFDMVMVKPYNPLFRVLMGGADVIDLITLPFLILTTFYYGLLLHPHTLQVFAYLFLLANGLIIATAFHIAVLGLAIITLEIDHTIMIYRDIVSLGKLPVNVYRKPVGFVLTYLLPVGMMITYPVKAILNELQFHTILFTFLVGVLLYISSLKFWNFALKKYTSASS